MKDKTEQVYLDKIITINDYYDGINLGIATLGGKPCIYESFFYDTGDTSTDLFYLTPIDEDTYKIVMNDWERWIKWVEEHGNAKGWLEQKQIHLEDIASQSKYYRQFIRHANFQGRYDNFHSHIENLNVVWTE